MSRFATVPVATALVVVMGSVAEAQVRTTVRAQTSYESYTFDPGLPYATVAEFAIPVGIDLSFGRRVDVTLSTGYVSLDISPDSVYSRVSGMIDTEARIGINIIPGRLIAVITGAVPTGTKVDSAQSTLLAPIASDVIGFAVPTLGAGGSLGGGFVGAVPVGKFALGLGATYSYPFSYQPFQDWDAELIPGSELRARVGIEGPAARTTYVRFAGVFAVRAKDEFGGAVQPGIGQRFIGYGEMVQGLGSMQLTLYAFDVYRGQPSIEGTALGAAILPKGNLIAAGFRHAIPVTRSFSVAPRAEWRMSTVADTTAGSSLTKAGSSIRLGVDARQTFSPGVSLALFGSGLFGDIRPTGGADIPLSGWRAGLMLSVAR
jgi:hypothetical protein